MPTNGELPCEASEENFAIETSDTSKSRKLNAEENFLDLYGQAVSVHAFHRHAAVHQIGDVIVMADGKREGDAGQLTRPSECTNLNPSP